MEYACLKRCDAFHSACTMSTYSVKFFHLSDTRRTLRICHTSTPIRQQYAQREQTAQAEQARLKRELEAERGRAEKAEAELADAQHDKDALAEELRKGTVCHCFVV